MDNHDLQPSANASEDRPPSVSPDFTVEGQADDIENEVFKRGYETTPMVGLGGSAGSIAALTQFFQAMPCDSGMVFVVILHLSPTHASTMPALLGRTTAMPVLHAEHGQKVQPNHVYVIPPGKYLATVDGHLKLTEIDSGRGKRVAVDLFFRSLADTHGPHAAAVVLSGADGDGALGIKRIKERGGLTIAQDPDESEHSGMPRSAIETGMVDWVLEVSQIPVKLLQYRDNELRLKLPPEDGPQPIQTPPPTADQDEAALRDILLFLRMRTGRDFFNYKRATILRRISRRMQVNSVEDLQGYMNFLRIHQGESGALLQDLLISVTNFFRDREAFEAVERHIPALFKNKTQNDTVRVWVPACATGEEAYSFAIMLLEQAQKIQEAPELQVFACDLDDQAIRVAREGRYPDAIAADVSEERLGRFFVKDHGGYRVRRELREMVLFAGHDLLKDSPFSRMELISCRNLLIYLNRDAQKRLFDTFHFALNPGGLLFLGSSEAVDEEIPLFRVIDKKHRIYAQQPVMRTGPPLAAGASMLIRAIQAHDQAQAGPVIHGKQFAKDQASHLPANRSVPLDRQSLTELHFRLIEQFAPPSVIVNNDYEILHLSEHAWRFLRLGGGAPTADLLRIVHPMLRSDLRSALFRASESNSSIDAFDLPVEIDDRVYRVDIHVSLAPEIAPGCLLIVFDDRGGPVPTVPGDDALQVTNQEPVVRHLERQLEQVKENLRDTVEQHDASTEELKASNEELQAMNEELRSATEELETSREELQSINEELTTVNQEMKNKMEEVAEANSDLQNLMASTSIATVFLDRELRIKRYTPRAADIFNLIPGDVGRPLVHLKHGLEYPDLIADAERVLKTLVPIEHEVTDHTHWFLARVQPYRTLDDRIAGVVLTFVDVSERKHAADALRISEERLRILIESANDYAIFTTDLDSQVNSWNQGAEAMFGYPESEILGQSAEILFVGDDRMKGDPEQESRTAREEGSAASERWHARKDGSTFYGSGSVMPLRDRHGALGGFVKIIRDLTQYKQTQDALAEHMDELTRFNAVAVGRELRMIELKREINDLCERFGQPARYSIDNESD